MALVAVDPVTHATMNGFVDFALDLGDRARDFHFGPPVTLHSPEPLAFISRFTPFTWSASDERPLSVFSVWNDLPLQIAVVTKGTTANLAWLPRAGITLPSAFDGCCDWSVQAYETGTVDDYARLEWVGSMSTDWEVRLPPALASGVVAESESRPFYAP